MSPILKSITISVTILVSLVTVLLLIQTPDKVERGEDVMTVFAASGVTDLMHQFQTIYEAKTGRKVVFNFDSSSRLARQIQAGANPDIYISANTDWINYLQDAKILSPGDCKPFASTDLALIVPEDSSYGDEVAMNEKFASNFQGAFAIGDYAHVPVGRYTKQALQSLGLFELLNDKLALSSNASNALRFVETKQCDAGIVYASSAIASSKVKIVATIPADCHDPIIFTSAICNPKNIAAQDFFKFINAPNNQGILTSYGFTTVDQDMPPTAYASTQILSQDEWAVLKLSIKVASFCVLVIIAPGILIGWFLARFNFPGKMIVEALMHLPLIMPPVVIGYMALIMLGKNGILGRFLYEQFGISIAFTWKAAVVTSAMMSIPLLIRSVKLSVELIDKKLENAAASLGASPLKVFMTVTLPLALPGIISGMILAFARSLGEFGATATFAGNIPGKTRTLSLAIHSLTQIPSAEHSAVKLVCISITISILALLFSELLSRKLLHRTGAICHA